MKKTPLEHFQDIKELEVADEQGKTVVDILPYKCEQVEKVLLKAQEQEQYYFDLIQLLKENNMDYYTLKEMFKTKSKKEKALEIIKEKRVNVGTFIHLTKILKKDYEQCKALNNTFGANICETEKEFLTEEEFSLLKEVLE